MRHHRWFRISSWACGLMGLSFLFLGLMSTSVAQTSKTPASRSAQSQPASRPSIAKTKTPMLKPAKRSVRKLSSVQQQFADNFRKRYWDRGPLLALAMIFGLGFLVSLSPCVYPMIPITIAVIGATGAKKENRRTSAFMLSLSYVLGMAVLYSVLGLLVAFPMKFMGGNTKMMGWLMQNNYFLGALVGIFTLMALSMFGLFDLNLPSSWQTKLSMIQGNGYTGVFILGMIGGVLATPCSGPVLIGLLAFIAQTGNPLLGGFLLFVFSFGIGVPFLLLGAGVVSALPRSGSWMNEVKKLFGVMLLGAALYYAYLLLLRHLDIYAMILGVILLLLGVFAGAMRPYAKEDGTWIRLKQVFGILCLLLSVYLIGGSLLRRGFVFPPAQFKSKVVTVTKTKIVRVPVATVAGQLSTSKPAKRLVAQAKADPCLPPANFPKNKPFWIKSEKKAVACALRLKRPMMIDFWAEWCTVCKLFEKNVINSPKIVAESRRFVMAKIEYSEESKEGERLRKKYEVIGLPWIRFMDRQGKLSPTVAQGKDSIPVFLGRLKKFK